LDLSQFSFLLAFFVPLLFYLLSLDAMAAVVLLLQMQRVLNLFDEVLVVMILQCCCTFPAKAASLQVPGVLFTPINPHSLSSRPLVLPESIQIRVKVPADSRSEMWCSFDGKDRQRLAPGDAVLIYMSQHPIPTVCKLDASHDWFLSMHNGLHWNIRKQQAGAGK